jgi:rare lipoprotein A
MLLKKIVSYTVCAVLISILLEDCASSPRFTKERYEQPSVTPTVTSHPPKNAQQTYEGIASFYSTDFHGKKTANGDTFDMNKFTAAHRSFPFGTKVKVTNKANGKSVVVTVNDRGPFKLERIMDLSYGAAEALDMIKTGTAHVTLEVLEWGKE